VPKTRGNVLYGLNTGKIIGQNGGWNILPYDRSSVGDDRFFEKNKRGPYNKNT
jgi:hypothetical protein